MRYRPGVLLLLLLLVSLPLAAQTTNITGRVTMSDGSPLPGVTITDDLGVTAVTDADGRYTIAVPSSRAQVKLTAALAGFSSRTATVDVRTGASADFVMRVSFGQEITVGSRAIGAEAEKAVPVDVIPREQIETAAPAETSQIIEKIAPSFNFPRPTISDGTDSVRPATLRGLGPDQVLVMLNGKRRHVSALVNVNNTVGRGSAGVDLNAIPAAAIDSVEILRDGAAAQYGSDAIAGVLNLVLKSDAQPLKLEVKGGSTTHGDGQMIDASLSGGWALGRGAVFGVFEYRNRYATNRALPDPREQVVPGDAGNNAVRQPNTHWGDSYARDLMALANLNLPVSADGKQIAYGFATWGLRHGSHGGNFRRAMDQTNWPTIYPLGFLPLIEPRVSDTALTGGMRGEMAGWFYDASAGYGRNKFDFYVRNSLNASLGPTIPPNQTSFYAGALADKLYTVNFDLSKRYDLGLAGPVNVAGGVEWRREGYEVMAGEPASYIHGGSKSQNGGNAAPGSQVFPGFRPSNEVDASRNSRAIYIDTEGDVLAKLRLGLAVRYENFSDFGSTTNGKITARVEATDWLVLRGAASTGFRAPSLGQSWFSAVSTNFLPDPVTQIVGPFEVGTFPVSSAIARALGAQDLKPEKSRNYSAGLVFEPMSSLEITLDYFDIDIEDRIVLSGNLNQPQVQAIIAPFGVNTARFFTNAISTRTKGYDFVVNHHRPTLGGRLDLSAAYSRNKTNIYGEIITPPQLQGLGSVIFDRRETRRVQCGQPEDNIRLMESFNHGAFNATARQARFGEYCSLTIATTDDQDFPATWLTDLELSYKWSRYTLAVGAENLFDAFPQRNLRFRSNGSLAEQAGGAGVFTYPINTPFGMNGRFVYSRIAYTF
jgi:iron complex outermembrane recepter protein